jgi:hypothetical protein
MLSAEGGVEIETVAEENPDAIAKIWIDPSTASTRPPPVRGSQAANLNPDAAVEGAVDILQKLYTAYVEGDADLCEINPLILTPEGRSTRSTPRSPSTATPCSVTPTTSSSTRPRPATNAKRPPTRRASSTSGSRARSA